MKNKLINLPLMSLGIVIAALPCLAHADGLVLNAATSLTQGSYSGSILRDRFSDVGVVISGAYLDQGGVTVGFSNTRINLKAAAAIKQDNTLLSGRLNYWPDGWGGRMTLRLDAHRINNNDATGNTDDVSVIAPQVSWLSTDKTLYADLGYAKSRYQNQLDVTQFTPTIGFGLNDGADWIQVRNYLIGGLNPARASGKSSTYGLDASWTHYFAPGSALLPASLALTLAAGEKIYAVDMDAQSVANLADLNKGAATVALGWNITKNTKLLVLAGQSRYRNVTLSNDYKLNLGYVNLMVNW